MKKKNHKKKYKKRKVPMSRSKKITLSVCLGLLSVAIICATVFGIWFSANYNYRNLNPNSLDAVDQINEDVINVALFGIDSRKPDTFTGLSDSIMILSVNTNSKQIRLISIMRDTLVRIPGSKKPQKINSAYNQGGAKLAVKTLNKTFGLDITDYATVNFYGMEDIIDLVGGITVDVTESELYWANIALNELADIEGVKRNHIKGTGAQTLNGLQAVAWARTRKAATADGVVDDFGRTDRQRTVMEQLFNKVMKLPKKQYFSLAKKMMPYVETSMSISRVLGIASSVLDGATFHQTRVPLSDYVINGDFRATGESTVYYNLEFAQKIIHAFIYDGISPEDYIEQNGIDKTPWYSSSGSVPSYTSSDSHSTSSTTTKTEKSSSSDSKPSSYSSSEYSSSVDTSSVTSDESSYDSYSNIDSGSSESSDITSESQIVSNSQTEDSTPKPTTN
ncbi:MAG: LCP family protein [bacterium]|nr:LCP family protein [bacterium]